MRKLDTFATFWNGILPGCIFSSNFFAEQHFVGYQSTAVCIWKAKLSKYSCWCIFGNFENAVGVYLAIIKIQLLVYIWQLSKYSCWCLFGNYQNTVGVYLAIIKIQLLVYIWQLSSRHSCLCIFGNICESTLGGGRE